ncbi:MAG: hypothetical protein J7M38_12610 [Armatimonadetes bacterium]|nr:hypothetical protein [Armatimonadota bacterium]
MGESDMSDRSVTWEAADKGASCALGCVATSCLLLGLGFGLWYISGGVWKLVVAIPLLLAGMGLAMFLRSPRRGRWEVTFDPDARVITLLTRVEGREQVQVINYDDVAGIELEQIRRRMSDGEVTTFQRPVILLTGGREPVRLDERLSVRDPEHAREVLEQMRGLLE